MKAVGRAAFCTLLLIGSVGPCLAASVVLSPYLEKDEVFTEGAKEFVGRRLWPTSELLVYKKPEGTGGQDQGTKINANDQWLDIDAVSKVLASPPAPIIIVSFPNSAPSCGTPAFGASFLVGTPLLDVPDGSHEDASRYFLPHVFLLPCYRQRSVSAGS